MRSKGGITFGTAEVPSRWDAPEFEMHAMHAEWSKITSQDVGSVRGLLSSSF